MYGQDRVFANILYEQGIDEIQEAKVKALEKAGHPVIRIYVADLINLGAQFFLWEMAMALAVALFEIHVFDQPNVQGSTDYTKKFL